MTADKLPFVIRLSPGVYVTEDPDMHGPLSKAKTWQNQAAAQKKAQEWTFAQVRTVKDAERLDKLKITWE